MLYKAYLILIKSVVSKLAIFGAYPNRAAMAEGHREAILVAKFSCHHFIHVSPLTAHREVISHREAFSKVCLFVWCPGPTGRSFRQTSEIFGFLGPPR